MTEDMGYDPISSVIISLTAQIFLPLQNMVISSANNVRQHLSFREQISLRKIYEWLNNYQLILNWDKTKIMRFSYPSHNQIDPHIQPTKIQSRFNGSIENIQYVELESLRTTTRCLEIL